MFHNYFFLKRLAYALDSQLSGAELVECFSQNRDELILSWLLADHREFYIRANLDAAISLLFFPDTFARSGKNSVDLFEELVGLKVTGVTPFRYDRSFAIHFENGHQLIFKLHARRGNILLAKDQSTLRVFRNSLKADLALQPEELNKEITISKEAFSQAENDPIQLIPALGKEAKIFLENTQFYEKQDEEKWDSFQQLMRLLDTNPIYLIHSQEARISLLEKSEESTTDPIAATNWLYQAKTRSFFFDKEKQTAINSLKQKIKKSESYISKTATKLQQLTASRNPEEIANILMANLGALQQGLTKAVLHDFYTDSPIEIKLNTKLSPQKNAENLYRKAKNRQLEIDQLEENIAAKHRLIATLSKQVLDMTEIEDFRTLRKRIKELGLIQKPQEETENLPYHQHELDGWIIMVGRNAKANDELTLKVAKKNDLWLHAKDVAGSHVVVRQRPGQNFPKHIIEAAASLAAHHSKRQNDTLCPVIFTEKKFVRKMKGAPSGQVIVEKEEVVMVEPSNEL